MGAEEALVYLGGQGLWQFTSFFTISTLLAVPSYWQAFAIVFEGFTYHPYHCYVSENETSRLIPTADCSFYESCEIYKYNASYKPEERISCPNGYKFYPDYYLMDKGTTIAMEFALWCRLYVVELTQMCYTGGIMFGCFVVTPLSDIYGRKKVFFGSQLVMCLFGIAMAFSTNVYLFGLFQFLTGTFTMANDLAGFVLANELFPADIRAYMAPTLRVFDAVALMSLVVYGYYIRHWREFQLAISILPLITMMYWWHCPESTRWLVVNERFDEARVILDECARCNESDPVPDEVLKMEPPEISTGSKHVTLRKYLGTGKTLVYFLVVAYQLFIAMLMIFGLSLMAQALPGDLFLSFFILAALEIPGTLIAIVLLYYVGRRIPTCLLNMGIAVLLALASLFTAKPDLVKPDIIDAALLVTILTCIGKMLASALMGIVMVYAQEIFPTNIRSSGVGCLGGIGFIGSFIAPLAVTFSRASKYLPTAVFAALGFIGMIVSLFGPETKGRVLPTTHEEVLAWGYKITEEDMLKMKEQNRKMAERRKMILAYRRSRTNGSVNPGYEPEKMEMQNGKNAI